MVPSYYSRGLVQPLLTLATFFQTIHILMDLYFIISKVQHKYLAWHVKISKKKSFFRTAINFPFGTNVIKALVNKRYSLKILGKVKLECMV